jgi:hypothetical protein
MTNDKCRARRHYAETGRNNHGDVVMVVMQMAAVSSLVWTRDVRTYHLLLRLLARGRRDSSVIVTDMEAAFVCETSCDTNRLDCLYDDTISLHRHL